MIARKTALEPGLYLVATPIGNARDITLRALDVLESADVLAAEDTRTLRKLMEIHGISVDGRRMIAYHDHSGDAARRKVVEAIEGGAAVAYASEAGTPLVADPGFRLVADVGERGLGVTAVPGASAVLGALSVAGLPTDRFTFVGFAPSAGGARRRFLESLTGVGGTLVFYESPRRLAAFLSAAAEVFGAERPAAVCRELTKKFEEVFRGTLGDLKDEIGTVKGEVVVLIGPATTPTAPDDAAIDSALREAMSRLKVKDAAAEVAGAMGLSKRDLYQRALTLKES